MTFLILGTLKFRKKAPGLIFFKGPFWGAYIRRGLSTEGNLRFKIDWASLIRRSKFTVLLCISGQFSKYNHRGAYIWSGDLTEGFFALPVWVAYFWRGLFSEFYGMWKRRTCQIGPAYDLLFIILSKRCELRAHLLFWGSYFRTVLMSLSDTHGNLFVQAYVVMDLMLKYCWWNGDFTSCFITLFYSNGVCTNVEGSFQCECQSGF